MTGMTKVIVGLVETDHGPNMQWIDAQSRFSIDKLASVGTYIPPILSAKIIELRQNLPVDKVAFYNRALGSFESFGINRNGDGFVRDELRAKHGTFVSDARYFRNHQNRPECPSFGQPVASAFNEKTDIVDLIIVADKIACLDEIERLERGASVPTSMGAKIAYDVCLICENKARSRLEYCDHVKVAADPPYGMGQVLPNGQVCGVLNPDPRFFDISKVVVAAARESEHLMKVASARTSYDLRGVTVHSTVLAEELGYVDKISEVKDAAMIKEVPSSATMRENMPLVEGGEKTLPDAVIDSAIDRGGVQGFLRNTAAAGMVLKPEEFRRGVERATGKKTASFLPPTAEEIASHVGMNADVFIGDVDDVVMQSLSPHFSKRSAFQPALVNRIQRLPVAVVARDKTAGDASGSVRDMYVAYRAQLARDFGTVGGLKAETWVSKVAGTQSRIVSDFGRMYAKMAFADFPRADLTERFILRMKKVAKAKGHTDNDAVPVTVTGSVAEDLGEEALDLIAAQSLL